jgi:hypothetical protein
MAIVKGFQKITGALQNATFYTIQGGDQVYVRMKGGPSKRMIKTSPKFEKVRRNNEEWKGCTRLASAIRGSFYPLKSLEDYPVIGALNAIAKQIQLTDTEGTHGQRGLYLSKNKDLIGGFNLSRKQVLESVLRVPITAVIHREEQTAQVTIPSINTGMYLYNFRNLPYFRIIMAFAAVLDMGFSEEKNRYETLCSDEWGVYTHFESPWLSTTGVAPALNQPLKLPFVENDLPESVTLVLSVGVEFGKAGVDGNPEAVKYAGCGKVVQVG